MGVSTCGEGEAVGRVTIERNMEVLLCCTSLVVTRYQSLIVDLEERILNTTCLFPLLPHLEHLVLEDPCSKGVCHFCSFYSDKPSIVGFIVFGSLSI